MKIKTIALFVLLLMLGACINTSDSESKGEVTPMIDVNQFSQINSNKLIEILGEPEQIIDYEWLVPSTNKSIVGKMYIYEKNKYEFILFEDKVTRLNIYSGKFMGYDDTSIPFEKEEDIFAMLAIEPNSSMKKTADTNYALRYSPVSDKVSDLWIQEIEGNEFGIAKITYDAQYF